MVAEVRRLRETDVEEINEDVWAENGEAGLLDTPPIEIEMRQGHPEVRARQYPISSEGRKGLTPIVRDLIKNGILEPCMSPYNTPVISVRKPDGTYRLVQDLREINKHTVTKYPVVANPYTLLSKVSPNHKWFSVIN